jgi:hypothetical protein
MQEKRSFLFVDVEIAANFANFCRFGGVNRAGRNSFPWLAARRGKKAIR